MLSEMTASSQQSGNLMLTTKQHSLPEQQHVHASSAEKDFGCPAVDDKPVVMPRTMNYSNIERYEQLLTFLKASKPPSKIAAVPPAPADSKHRRVYVLHCI